MQADRRRLTIHETACKGLRFCGPCNVIAGGNAVPDNLVAKAGRDVTKITVACSTAQVNMLLLACGCQAVCACDLRLDPGRTLPYPSYFLTPCISSLCLHTGHLEGRAEYEGAAVP